MHCAALFVLAALATAARCQSLAQCRAQAAAKRQCMLVALRDELGVTVEVAAGREVLRQCLEENGCEVTSGESVQANIHACMSQHLGLDENEFRTQCMEQAGYTGADGGRPVWQPLFRTTYPMHGGRVRRACGTSAGGDYDGAIGCVKERLGIDLETVDTEAVIAAVCAAESGCAEGVADSCAATLRASDVGHARALCKCRAALGDQVGVDVVHAAEETCAPLLAKLPWHLRPPPQINIGAVDCDTMQPPMRPPDCPGDCEKCQEPPSQ